MLLSVADLREHVESDLPDTALQRVLDAEEGEIVHRYGVDVAASETLPGGGEWLVLERLPASISSIVEWLDQLTSQALDPSDYVLWPGGGWNARPTARATRLAIGHSGWW